MLQDLGYTIDNSEPPCGLVVGSRDRDATETGQVVAAMLVAALAGAPMPIDKNQKIRASLVTRPVGDGKNTNVLFRPRLVRHGAGA